MQRVYSTNITKCPFLCNWDIVVYLRVTLSVNSAACWWSFVKKKYKILHVKSCECPSAGKIDGTLSQCMMSPRKQIIIGMCQSNVVDWNTVAASEVWCGDWMRGCSWQHTEVHTVYRYSEIVRWEAYSNSGRHCELCIKAVSAFSSALALLADEAIHRIRSTSGQIATDSKQINDSLMKYYVNVYSSRSTATDSAITDFFKSIEMPTLSADARNLFDTAFAVEEMILL